MSKTFLIILIIIVLAGAGEAVYYFVSTKQSSTESTVPSTSTSSQSTDSCSLFSTRFGISVDELQNFINSEPDAARVLQGFHYLIGEIIGQSSGNFPLIIEVDETGKVVNIVCKKLKIAKSEQNVEFTIPEADFIYIVQNRNNLQKDQATTYLKNITATPTQAKQIILQRIQGL